jgi:hypothetical protein
LCTKNKKYICEAYTSPSGDRKVSRVTCWLAASLDSAKSGHVFRSRYRQDDISITNPVINSRCHISKPTVNNKKMTLFKVMKHLIPVCQIRAKNEAYEISNTGMVIPHHNDIVHTIYLSGEHFSINNLSNLYFNIYTYILSCLTILKMCAF